MSVTCLFRLTQSEMPPSSPASSKGREAPGNSKNRFVKPLNGSAASPSSGRSSARSESPPRGGDYQRRATFVPFATTPTSFVGGVLKNRIFKSELRNLPGSEQAASWDSDCRPRAAPGRSRLGALLSRQNRRQYTYKLYVKADKFIFHHRASI